MNSLDYNYKIAYKKNDYNEQRIIVFTQRALPNGKEISIEIPEEDLSIVLSKLSNIHSIIDDPIIPYEENDLDKQIVEPNIIQTLVALFLSGVPIKDLATQYNYPEETIKSHLEYKGIVIFDEI